MVQYYAHEINDDFSTITCSRLADCFLDMFNQGFRQGGGIGDMMSVVGHNEKNYWDNFFYQMLFFFCINVIFLNIIFGIIIDTFAELREESKEREEDTNHCCYVCGFCRKDFAAESKDFDYHIENEHNPWYYIFFLYYIEKQGKMNLNGLEQFAQDNYALNKTDWLPIGNTGYLEHADDDVLAEVATDVHQIKSWLKKYDYELTDTAKKDNKERKLIGLKKKEIHKQVEVNIDERLSRGIIVEKSDAKSERIKLRKSLQEKELQLNPIQVKSPTKKDTKKFDQTQEEESEINQEPKE